jgi:hypothetical protein
MAEDTEMTETQHLKYGVQYMLFQPKDELSAAEAAFVAKFGTQPAEWKRWPGGLLVGPCPEKENPNDS